MTEERKPTYEELEQALAAAERQLEVFRDKKGPATGGETRPPVSGSVVERPHHIPRELLAIRKVHQLIVAEQDPARLIQAVCDSLTRTLGYFNAWIALLDDESGKTRAIAFSGFEKGLSRFRDDLEKGRFPSCMSRCIEKDGVHVVKNPMGQCPDCPLSPEYTGKGGLATRLSHDNRIYGMLCVSVPQSFAEDTGEQEFFSEMARDLSFALHKIGEGERLRENQKRISLLSRMLDAAPAAISIHDTEGRFLYANRMSAPLHGYDDENEYLALNLKDLDVPETVALLNERMERIALQGEDRFEVAHFRKDGSVFPLEVVAKSILWDGQPAVLSIATDITERKEAQEKAVESHRLLMNLASMVPGVIYQYRLYPDGRSAFPYASQGMYDIYELWPEDVREDATPVFGRLHPEDHDRVAQAILDSAKTLEMFYCEFRVILPRQGLRWRWCQAKPQRMEDGGTLWHGIISDITGRKRSEDELWRRENLLQKIFEILPIGLWFADKDGNIIRGNPMGVKIWGAEPHVPLSEYGIFKAWRLPSRELIAADDWALAKTIRQGVTIVDELLEIESFDGKRKTILNYSTPVLNDEGKIDGAIVVNLDITDRKALEDQLLQAQKMESVGRLAGGVAHDFNNMLGVILGHAEMAMEQVAPADPIQDDLREILNAARRSADITRQLLAFARRQPISPRVIDLNDTIEGMLKILRRLIGENIDLAWHPDGSIRPVRMDPSQIDQVLANLCVNARDAIRGVGKVTIETGSLTLDQPGWKGFPDAVPGDYVLLTVSDNGCGMDDKTLENLFEPFFTTKGLGKGTGLGLATVYGIVRQNGGFIHVDSEPERGTSFRLCLPAYGQETGQVDTGRDNEAPCPLGHETVLLVEDEPSILRMATRLLEKLGYRVLTASTPGEAIDLAAKHENKIHLLMTDVIMPEMNGKDLATALQANCPNLRCLFMSGYTADVIAHHGVLDEGVQFIQKPFSKNDLATKVRKLLDGGAKGVDPASMNQ